MYECVCVYIWWSRDKGESRTKKLAGLVSSYESISSSGSFPADFRFGPSLYACMWREITACLHTSQGRGMRLLAELDCTATEIDKNQGMDRWGWNQWHLFGSMHIQVNACSFLLKLFILFYKLQNKTKIVCEGTNDDLNRLQGTNNDDDCRKILFEGDQQRQAV